MSQPGDGPTVARQRLGTQLRALRTAAGISGEEAAAAIRSSPAKVSRVENGLLPVRQADVQALLDLYGAADREEMLALAGNRPGTVAAASRY
jgi:transcriptional regulator with XRE-family HTH domain